MSFKIVPPLVQPYNVPIDSKHYELARTCKLVYQCGDDQHKLIVPKGFVYDGVSVPRFVWSITGIRPDGLNRAAGCIHDYLYRTKGHIDKKHHKICGVDGKWRGRNISYSKEQCDLLFLAILREAGIPEIKCLMMFYAVKVFGVYRWNRD